MPVYTYRREDGSTFDIRQRFSDEALAACPETGQRVTRVIQAAGIIFRGSGFYVNDSRKSAGANGKARKAEKAGGQEKTKQETGSAQQKDAPAAAKSEKAAPAKKDSA